MAVTDHVKIELDVLQMTATRLGQVAGELKNSRSAADQDGRVVAHADLASALGEFSDNWRVHRENLITAVEGAHGFVAKAVTAYRELDLQLTEAVTIPEGQGGK
ncbi:hypothetical protein [Kineosporia sp. NBRC 101731]|uniref:hypothetical protein n=1 Tax=Kineosporia sp. NBRC 101731 TaxID=3032199 RepID=UPI0024A160BA|nr:hypothetical protein [Kineosporia sp. NBRC 101731]GLY30949.1 hypothetical protein Kisp02_43140 [Kineosporia sp. NBRC 101731]